MPNQLLLNSIKKVLDLVEELNKMSSEDLSSICLQYGKDNKALSREDMIQIILKEELSKEELDNYQAYLRYYYFTSFREQNKGINSLDRTITEIEKYYEEKANASREVRDASDKKRKVEISLINALPLVRLNIEYSNASRVYEEYIKARTRTGMKRASLSDEIDDLKRGNAFLRFIKKGAILAKEEEKSKFEINASKEVDSAYNEYVEGMKQYAKMLKQLFFKMLDNRDILEAVMLKRSINNDFSQESSYVVGHLYDIKVDEDIKEEIYSDFLQKANFDPEVELTGEIFYEAVKKYVGSYYEIMADRNKVRESRCVSRIREIVQEQRSIIEHMKETEKQVDLFSKEEEETLLMIYEQKKGIKK